MKPVVLTLLLLAPLLSGCRFNFVPLIPPPVAADLPTRIEQAELKRVDKELVLRVKMDARIDPGYLTVHWFDGAKEIGSDSIYLDKTNLEAELRLEAAEKGAYRAVLSFDKTVLRQLELYEVSP